MVSVLIHASVPAALHSARSQEEVQRALKGLLRWNGLVLECQTPCYMTALTSATLQSEGLWSNLDWLDTLYQRYGDSSWHPRLLKQACMRLFSLPCAASLLLGNKVLDDYSAITLMPDVIERNLLEALKPAACYDAGLLAYGETRAAGDGKWAVAVSCREEIPPMFDVQASGLAELHAPDGACEIVHVETTLRYVREPAQLIPPEEALLTRMRDQVLGKSAFLIGGDGRGMDEARLRASFGFSKVTFLAHNQGHGQNIQRARKTLKTGNYDFFIHFVEFGSHSASNLKGDMPESCTYVAVNGSATFENIVRALSRVLHMEAES